MTVIVEGVVRFVNSGDEAASIDADSEAVPERL